MNRSFHAFAVLLVSLAGGIIAATWTATLPTSRSAMRANAERPASSPPLYCACNPESHARFEEGCARDKTTGELYGCGLGLGNNGVSGKTVIGRTAKVATASIASVPSAIRQGVAGIPWKEIAASSQRMEMELAAIQTRAIYSEPQPEATPERTHEQEYAAAELAAAGVDSNQQEPAWLHLNERLAPLHRSISSEAVSHATKSAMALVGQLHRQWERQSRLWLVENGLHRYWDDAEEAVMSEQIAGARMRIEEEDFDRWFENFPPPITKPNRLINPIEPKDDLEDSRRIILATAKALETLSGMLHQTAENLARHAKQDVAELHKLKSGLEERR